ncbi:hypothetical protein [Paenibacillus sp. DYY-L-2]|uniref:hypothetical protein n=1 Tax=Paenibacillus sp. DYY-L-2 TaxID=3447013 RepID=UPI003F500D8C
MNFIRLVKRHIGQEVEVITAKERISGELASVDYFSLTLKVSPDKYDLQNELVLIPVQVVELIRVKSA